MTTQALVDGGAAATPRIAAAWLGGGVLDAPTGAGAAGAVATGYRRGEQAAVRVVCPRCGHSATDAFASDVVRRLALDVAAARVAATHAAAGCAPVDAWVTAARLAFRDVDASEGAWECALCDPARHAVAESVWLAIAAPGRAPVVLDASAAYLAFCHAGDTHLLVAHTARVRYALGGTNSPVLAALGLPRFPTPGAPRLWIVISATATVAICTQRVDERVQLAALHEGQRAQPFVPRPASLPGRGGATRTRAE